MPALIKTHKKSVMVTLSTFTFKSRTLSIAIEIHDTQHINIIHNDTRLCVSRIFVLSVVRLSAMAPSVYALKQDFQLLRQALSKLS
jgi:hypothetical protein